MKAQKNLSIKITLKNNNKATSLFRCSFLFSLLFIIFFFFLPNLTQAQLTFQHWQTFRQTEAFAPQFKWEQSRKFLEQPSGSTNVFMPKTTSSFSTFVQQQSPGYLDFHELGWFCTLDLRLDLTMKMPFRFRLGTLDQVNRKEGYYKL